MDELKKHRCCFTGHRPTKMQYTEEQIAPLLEKAIDEAIADGFKTFITGMAEGVDIWAAEIVINRRKKNDELHLVCVLPHKDFEIRRCEKEKKRFKSILVNSDYIRMLSVEYYTGCYQFRNEWMVNHSSRVIAVFNGNRSGTKNTVDYAMAHGVEVKNVL